MRTKNSIRNSIVGVAASCVSIIIGFFAQRIFIEILGTEYLGVNGLFSNILSMLSIAELGIGGTIIFHLYKPISQNDIELIKSLLGFYKKAYNYIACIILVLGLLFIPFLNYFIGKTTLDLNFKLVYILFLFQTISSYICTYKRSILYGYQKNYIINIVHMFYLVIVNILQLFFLFVTKNYYLYLVIKIFCNLLENISINYLANRYYPYIKEKNIQKLNKHIYKDIFRRVKAQFLHTIGGVIINSTDNIVISKFFGVATVGLYSNYFLIINSVRTLFSMLISSTTASVGNLLVESNAEKSFSVYKRIRFFNFWSATFCSVSVLIIMQSFIVIWIGDKYLLSSFVLSVLVFNLYQKLMRNCNDVFLTAAGICVENRFVPIIESILNISCSIIFLKVFGLAGVFLGTIASGLVLWCYSYPKFAYKKIFKRNYYEYTKETLGYLCLFIIISLVTYFVSVIINFNNVYLEFLSNVVISLIVPNFLMLIIFSRNDNFRYFTDLLLKNNYIRVFKISA